MPNQAHPYIWSEADSAARHRYLNFRYTFALKSAVAEAQLHLFADTRYRLYVNGTVIGHGPTRFKVEFPEYDSYDLAPYLVAGRNVIAVTVCSYAWGTFLSDDSAGGLTAWGHVDTAEGRTAISTASGWKVSERTGYRSETSVMSFALGMMEDQDTRQEPAGWMLPLFDDADWAAAVPVADQNHWGSLKPRSIPQIEEVADRVPHHVTAYAVETQNETCVSRVLISDTLLNGSTALAVNLRSQQAMPMKMAAIPVGHWLNGERLKPVSDDENAGRCEYEITLREGDNILVAEIGIWNGFAEWAVGWPSDAPVTAAELPGSDAAAVCLPIGEYEPDTAAPACYARVLSDITAVEPLTLQQGLTTLPTLRGWRALRRIGPEAGFPLASGPQRAWVMDFVREVHGRITIDFDAPAGAQLLLTVSERLMPDGTVRSGFQTTRLQHRIVARGGRQQWTAMHPTGFRYLELMVLDGGAGVAIHDLRLVRLRPLRETGRFLCSDAVLNQVWQLCRETQVASIEDAYIDCPWRERGLYTGDQIIQYYVNLALFGDHSMMRHCIDLFYQTQDESGLIAPCTHRLPNWRHPDYAGLSIESLWHYWSCSGDTAFVEEKAEGIHRLLEGLNAIRDPQHGLVDGTDRIPYVDMSQIDRQGVSFGLNMFVYGAFVLGSRLLEVIGRSDEAARWRTVQQEVADRLRSSFRDPSARLFNDRRAEDVAEPAPSALGNALALYYGLVEGADAESCLEFVRRCAMNNLTVEHPKTSFDFHFSGYSSYYALAVLYRCGETDLAERFMRGEWRRMLDGGAWTCWEYFVPSHSLCHAWAASPAWYLSAYVLGLRYAEPGEPDKLIFDPRPGTVEWAEGTFPHPRGPIRVRWENRPGGLTAEIAAPDGVIIDTGGLDVAGL